MSSSQEKVALLSEDKSTLEENGDIGSTETRLPVSVKRIGIGAWALSKSCLCRHRWAGRSYRAYILVLTFLCYMCYHMCKKPFSVVKIVLAPNCSSHHPIHSNCTSSGHSSTHSHGWAPFDGDHCQTEMAIVDYSWLFSYAIAMFVSGYIGDRINLRYFLTVGMIGTGIGVGLLGVEYYAKTHHLWYFILVQVFSGAMQSTGWPGVVAVMGNWFGKQNRGLLMGIWNAHTSVGNILGTVVSSFWADSGKNWSWSFFVPAFIMIGAGVFMFFFLVPDPKDVGVPPPKHHLEQRQDKEDSPTEQYGAISPNPENPSIGTKDDDKEASLIINDEKQLSNKLETSPNIPRKDVVIVRDHVEEESSKSQAIGFLGALQIPGVIEYSLALFFAKFVAYTFLVWLPFYVANQAIGHKCLSHSQADWLSTTFDAGGILGGILNGFLSDLLRARATTCAVLLFLSVPALYLYFMYGSISVWLTIVMLIICGATINGPYAVITTAVSSDLGTHRTLRGNKQAKATVSAIIDGTGSIGAAIGPLVTGPLLDHYGWGSVFYLQMAACVASALLLSRLIVSELRAWWKTLKRRWQHTRNN